MPLNLLSHEGEAYFYRQFLEAAKADEYFRSLSKEVQWKQQPIKIFGKEVLQPRLTAWFADELKSYRYSGLEMHAQKWTSDLLTIKALAEKTTGSIFNSALLNFYRDGNDGVGWHRDNERSLGAEPSIASVSLGESRIFELRHYTNKKEKVTLELVHGSLLFMKGSTQQHWEHQVPKTKKSISSRLNITFRKIF